jgi:hypothetical protein
MPYNTVPLNTNLLESLRPGLLPADLVIRNLPSENERTLIWGCVAEQRGDLRAAEEYYRRVEGPAREQAQRALARLQSRVHRPAR